MQNSWPVATETLYSGQRRTMAVPINRRLCLYKIYMTSHYKNQEKLKGHCLFWVSILFHIHKYTWPAHTKIHVHLFKCFEQTHVSIFQANTISFWRHHLDLQTFCGIFKNDTHGRSTPLQLVLNRKWRHQTKTRRTDGSAIQVCFPSGLTPIDTFCQLQST